MKIIGKTPINPLVFYSGKFSGYVSWVLLLMSAFSTSDSGQIYLQKWISLVFLFFGLLLTIVSLINLGKSTRLGIPTENTEFKTKGLYKISRNPMYLGFDMITISAIAYLNSIVIIILGAYSILVYHFIIVAEEKFLEKRFSTQFINYKKTVRRYI